MPYETITAAKKAGFPTRLGGMPLTVAQMNQIAECYDAIQRQGKTKVESPMAVCIERFKEMHKVKEGRWVLKERTN